jgi:membrane protein DedA with SNARE-associated domain/rhodanese-related sulfurtransferase
VSVVTFLLADLVWYEAGRQLGDRILHLVCRLSQKQGSCVHRATDVFARHGASTLLTSKFVVGLDAVAAPPARASRTSPIHFLVFDALGAMFSSGTYVALGYIFSNQLDRVATHVWRMGAFVALAVAAGFGFYAVHKFARWQHFVRQFKLDRITPEELRDKLNAGEDILLVDLQGRLNHVTKPMPIPGADSIDPRALEEYRDVEISRSREVVLYCACPDESTSARVALALRQKGVERVRPLAGGLQGWRDHGFPITSEVRISPTSAVRG